MNYKISKQAEVDLEKIWLYTFEEWSLTQADYYYDLIMNEIEYISHNPKSGKDYNTIRKGYYRCRVKSHFIFYRINQKDKIVEVIRILHQQMDIESHINE